MRWKLRWKLKWEYLLQVLLISNNSVVLGQVLCNIAYNKNNNIYDNNKLMLITKIFDFTVNDFDVDNYCDCDNNHDHKIKHLNYDISMMILQR